MMCYGMALMFCLHSALAMVVPVGKGSYTTALPSGAKVPLLSSGQPASPVVAATFNKPITTNKWWSSLLWKYNGNQYSENLFPYPLSAQAQSAGLNIAYAPTASVTPDHIVNGYHSQEYHYNAGRDLTISVNGLNASQTQVVDYSDWTVTALWQDAAHTLQITMGHGLPFMYCTCTGGAASIIGVSPPKIWYNQNGTLGITIGTNNYGIFAPSGSTWQTTSTTTLQSTLNGKNYFSVALLADNTPATLLFYQKHAYAFVTDSHVTWNYDANTAQLHTTFTLTTQLQETNANWVNQPLIALFRHQWLYCPQTMAPYTYQSPRGEMKMLESSSCVTSMPFHGVLPCLPLIAQDGVNGYSKSQLYNYVDTIFKQTPAVRWENASTQVDYWFGKAVGRMAQLLLIADQVGHTQAKTLFLQELEGYLQDWFTAANGKNLFYYDQQWNTLIGYPASYGSDNELNDHHFHWGYFIMASAVVAHFDPVWAQSANWGGMVELLIKDVANWDRTDTRFPFFRNFDIYEGHSWANGPSQFGSGNNQESSSEAINFAAGTFLWGLETNNTTIRDLGVYLYTTETNGIAQYWFDEDHQVFPAAYTKPNVGMVWGNGGAYATWFGGPSEAVHGINFTPITAASVYLGYNPAYLSKNLEFMLSNGGQTTYWPDIIMEATALTSPAQAIAQFNANPAYSVEFGETNAHTYYWLYMLNTLGQMDTTVTANCVSYAVFNNNNKKTYVAYNDQQQPITASFSDGTQLAVPARSMAYTTSSGTVTPPTYTTTPADDQTGSVTITFVPSAAVSQVMLQFSVNGQSAQTYGMISSGSEWLFAIPGLKTGDTVVYSITYTFQGMHYTTLSTSHVYKGTIPPIQDYTYSIAKQNDGTFLVTFIPTTPAIFVDLHYLINSANQRNVRMNVNGNTWSYSIPAQSSGAVITFSFTYTKNGLGHDSPLYTYHVV